jgi:glycerophosphoryl diester phosphodiesterase
MMRAVGARVFEDVPAFCGHRGSGKGSVGGARENTLDSNRAAVAGGLEWVEVDARTTADRVLVARHDPVVDDGRFIADLTAEETDALGLMRIADLFDDLPGHVAVDVDIKTALEDALRPADETTAALTAGLMAGEQGRRRLLATSFDPAALLIVRERAPELPLGLITWTRFPLRKAVPAAVHLGADAVAVHFGSFDLGQDGAPLGEREPAHVVGVAHEAGLQVVSWCPRPAEAKKLGAAGVDCLIVDDVPRAAAARGAAAAGESRRDAE